MTDPASLQLEIAKIEALITSLREALAGAALDQALQPLQQKRDLLMAQLSGAGAVAQDGSKAVGQSGVLIEGNVGGDVVTGIKADKVEIIQKEVDRSLPFPEALTRYLENIIATHQHLRLQGIRAGSQPLSVSLEKVYVSLTTIDKQVEAKPSMGEPGSAENFRVEHGYQTIGMGALRIIQ